MLSRRKCLVYCSLALLSAVLSGVCYGAVPKRLDWSLGDIVVEGLGDSLSVSLVWNIKDCNVEASKAVVFVPALRSGDHMVSLRPVSVYGKKAAKKAGTYVASGNPAELAVTEVPAGNRIVTQDVVPYLDWMDTVRVVLQVCEWSRSGGLVVRSAAQKAMFSKPARPDAPEWPWAVIEPIPDMEDTRTVFFWAPVRFAAGATKFDATRMSGEEAEALSFFATKLKAVTSTRRFSVRSGELTVTVPPCGRTKESAKLSKGRVQSLYSYFYRSGAFRNATPVRTGGGEDWDGTRDWIASSRYSGDGRLEEIVCLDLGSEYIWEALSREKPAAFEEMQRDCFPSLSRVYFKAKLRRPDFTTGQFVREVYDMVPEALSAHDFWLLAGESKEGSPEWIDILLAGCRFHPEDMYLNYDAAMALMDRGALNGAAELLRNVGTKTSLGEYAHASWLFRNGRYGEAVDILEGLKDKSDLYRAVYDQATPYLDWYDNCVVWEPYFP